MSDFSELKHNENLSTLYEKLAMLHEIAMEIYISQSCIRTMSTTSQVTGMK